MRRGARCLLAQAIEAEVSDLLGARVDFKALDGRQRVVLHGHLPEREVLTGIAPVALCQPRVRDRTAAADDPGSSRESPIILPPCMRSSKSIETLQPIPYLKGISSGDFSEALAALLGKDAPGLSASAIGRLKEGWHDDRSAWARDLSAKRHVYIRADGIHLQARLEDAALCILLIIGATPEGTKELVGFTDGNDAQPCSALPRSAHAPNGRVCWQALPLRHYLPRQLSPGLVGADGKPKNCGLLGTPAISRLRRTSTYVAPRLMKKSSGRAWARTGTI